MSSSVDIVKGLCTLLGLPDSPNWCVSMFRFVFLCTCRGAQPGVLCGAQGGVHGVEDVAAHHAGAT